MDHSIFEHSPAQTGKVINATIEITADKATELDLSFAERDCIRGLSSTDAFSGYISRC